MDHRRMNSETAGQFRYRLLALHSFKGVLRLELRRMLIHCFVIAIPEPCNRAGSFRRMQDPYVRRVLLAWSRQPRQCAPSWRRVRKPPCSHAFCSAARRASFQGDPGFDQDVGSRIARHERGVCGRSGSRRKRARWAGSPPRSSPTTWKIFLPKSTPQNFRRTRRFACGHCNLLWSGHSDDAAGGRDRPSH